MHQDDELDFGEDELVPQAVPVSSASSLDPSRPGSSTLAPAPSGAAGLAPGGAAGSKGGTTTSRSATAAGSAAPSASHALASSSALPSAASTPPVPPVKAHDETLDALGNKLPAGWVSRVSKSTGNIYYRNTVLNTSAWDIPTEPAAPQPSPPNPASPPTVVPAHPEPAPAVSVLAQAAPAPAPAAPVLAAEQAPAPAAPHPSAQDTQMHDAPSQDPPAAPKARVFVHPDRLKFADPGAVTTQPGAPCALLSVFLPLL